MGSCRNITDNQKKEASSAGCPGLLRAPSVPHVAQNLDCGPPRLLGNTPRSVWRGTGRVQRGRWGGGRAHHCEELRGRPDKSENKTKPNMKNARSISLPCLLPLPSPFRFKCARFTIILPPACRTWPPRRRHVSHKCVWLGFGLQSCVCVIEHASTPIPLLALPYRKCVFLRPFIAAWRASSSRRAVFSRCCVCRSGICRRVSTQ